MYAFQPHAPMVIENQSCPKRVLSKPCNLCTQGTAGGRCLADWRTALDRRAKDLSSDVFGKTQTHPLSPTHVRAGCTGLSEAKFRIAFDQWLNAMPNGAASQIV